MRKVGWLVAAAVVAAAVLPVTPALAAPRCFGRVATIVGTPGPDTIRGTKGRDVIVARGGADDIHGRGGNDLICSGRGADHVHAGAGNDRIKAGKGNDFVFGGKGDDIIRGGRGDDGALGGPGNDNISLGGGWDFADPGPGRDVYRGGAGMDFAGYLFSPPMFIDLTAGVANGDGRDRLFSIEGTEGGAGDDTIIGTTGHNFLGGGPGNDTIDTRGNEGTLDSPYSIFPGLAYDFVFPDHALNAFDPPMEPGNDTVTGGDGLNVVSYEEAANGVQVDLEAGTATGMGTDTLVGINAVVGSFHDDTLTGSDAAEGFDGLGGNDTIDGAGGTDVGVFFEARALVVDLSAGSATGETAVFDPVEGPTGAFVAFSHSLSGIEDVWGSFENDDTITGDDGVNKLFGLGGDDTIFGLGGDDLLHGDIGTDTLDGGEGTDVCIAGENVSNCEGMDQMMRALRTPTAMRWRAEAGNWAASIVYRSGR